MDGLVKLSSYKTLLFTTGAAPVTVGLAAASAVTGALVAAGGVEEAGATVAVFATGAAGVGRHAARISPTNKKHAKMDKMRAVLFMIAFLAYFT